MNRDLPQLSEGIRYVFFSSLNQYKPPSIYSELADYAYDTLYEVKSDIQQNHQQHSTNRIQYALNFLGNAAKYERAKELQFFKNFNQKYPQAEKSFNLNLTSPSQEDYINFIANINAVLKGTDAFKKRLDTEIKRISRVKDYRKTGDIQKLEYNKDNITKRVNRANQDNLTFFKRGGRSGAKKGSLQGGEQNFLDIFQRQTNQSKLTSIILQEYGPSLFQYSKNRLCLEPKQIAALIKVLSDEAYAMFLSEKEILSENSLIDAREIILGEDFQKFFNDLMNAPDLPNALEDIAQQYSLGYSPDDSKIDADKIKNLKKDLLYQYNKINADIPESMSTEQWLNFIGASTNELKEIYRSTLSVFAQAFYTGEDLNLIELVRNRIYAALGGTKNPTDDIYAGSLIINPDINYDSSKLESELAKIGRDAYKSIAGLKNLDTFFTNAELLREARQKQLEKLEEARQDINNLTDAGEYLLSHVNIHTTIIII